jgi:D-beta-D-heptose 7-phosphate kinase/D-beta-D-heptose 1-phosphate adenosyltransferase
MSPDETLTQTIERLPGARVACAGDVMLDRYVQGRIDRISPEAPVPVLRVERETVMAGGAGNVVRNLVALGASARFASVVGADEAGDQLRTLLASEPRTLATLITDPQRKTTIKTRYLSGRQQVLRADRETTEPLSPAVAKGLIDAIGRIVVDCSVAVLSDYNKGVLSGEMAGKLIAIARENGCRVIVDPKGRDYRRYEGADLITPNRAELAEACGEAIAPGEEARAAARLIVACGIGAALVTLGADGMVLVCDQGSVHFAADRREVFDVSGAGDTVVATMAAALATGASLGDAARLANLAAGIVVGKAGTAIVHASELASALRQNEIRENEAKVMTVAQARDHAERWRRQGLAVGFTNGCFDLLHPGHISLLDQAKAACDRLIVGLNSDLSVTRLKGAGRPIQPVAARARVLASMASVDGVVIFAEDTPMRLIEALRPDVLVKGADYRLDQVVGADLVQSYGGRVVLARLEPGYSTSATIARLSS